MTTYIVVSWIDPTRPGHSDGASATREYGTAASKQAAIHLAERLLPPDAEYLITTIHRTVHHGRTPREPIGRDRVR